MMVNFFKMSRVLDDFSYIQENFLDILMKFFLSSLQDISDLNIYIYELFSSILLKVEKTNRECGHVVCDSIFTGTTN